jgi:anionic cell wall polymer biosynthesis LytR-Cps2A-Psr (LCP) family protein
VDTQGPDFVDPADQWVFDPATGSYQLRLDPAGAAPAEPERPADPYGSESYGADPYAAGPHAAGPHEQEPYQQEPYQREPYQRDAYTSEPQPQEQEQQPYEPGSYATRDPYEPPAYSPHDPYRPGGHEPQAYEPGAHDPGGDRPEAGDAREHGPDAYPSAPTYGAGPAPSHQPGWEPAAGPESEPPSPAAQPDGGGRRAAGAGRRRRKPQQAARKKTLLWTAGGIGAALVVGIVAVVATGSGGGGGHHAAATDNSTVDVADAGAKAQSYTRPMNLLLIGTGGGADDKTGQGGAASTVLLHLAADRSNVTALDIPGNLVAGIPACPTPAKGGGTSVVPPAPQKPASPTVQQSLGEGGRDPSCTMRLVKQLTGVPVDHFLMADSASVKTLATTVGGLDACVSQLDRTGQTPAEPNRIGVQEQFLATLIRTANSNGTLADAARLKTLVTTVSTTLTMDTPIGSFIALNGLAGEYDQVDPKHYTFTTLPVKANTADPTHKTVVADQPKAAQLYSMLKNDVPVVAGGVKPDPKLVGSRATPHNTRVEIYNGSGVFGASQAVLAWLQNDKHDDRSTNGGDAPAKSATTTLKYAPNQADQARSLAAMMGLPASALIQGTKNAADKANMTLTLGADYTEPGTPIGPPTVPPKGVPLLTADKASCTG